MTPKERDPQFAFKACVMQKLAQGKSRPDAEQECRIAPPDKSQTVVGQMHGAGPLKAEAVFASLRAVFSEATSWWGYSVPHIHMLKMQPSTGPASMKEPNSPAWGPVASFPFHTAVAGKVWDAAKKLILKHKTASIPEILRMAMETAGVSGAELTPEDGRLLEMAIYWAQNGPIKTSVRSGGAPGGPFNSTTGITGTARRGLP